MSAMHTEVVTIFEAEGDSVRRTEKDEIVFDLAHPQERSGQLTIRPTWDYMHEFNIRVKATIKNAPWLFGPNAIDSDNPVVVDNDAKS